MHRTLLVMLLLTGCSTEGRLERTLHKLDAPGAQLVARTAEGTTWSGAAGEAQPGVPVSQDHVFFVGSITKMMTATAVLQLVDEGAVDLDDPVSNWVTDVRDDITVRHVLQHRSGLGDYFSHAQLDEDQGGSISQVLSPAELVALGTAVQNDGPQATGTYSNTNFIVAGMLLEAVDGAPADDILRDRIFEPLGMHDSGLQLTGEPFPEQLAWGHGGTQDGPTRNDPSVGWTAGSAYSTAHDVDRLVSAVVAGELLEPETHALQLTGVQADLGFEVDGMSTAYGLGVMVVDFRGTRIVGHLGMLDGYTNAGFADMEAGSRAVVLSNGDQTDAPFTAVRALNIASK